MGQPVDPVVVHGLTLVVTRPSGVQVIPAIQSVVKSLTVFVRSPIWAIPHIADAQRAYEHEEIDYFAKNPNKHLALRKSTESTMNSLFSRSRAAYSSETLIRESG